MSASWWFPTSSIPLSCRQADPVAALADMRAFSSSEDGVGGNSLSLTDALGEEEGRLTTPSSSVDIRDGFGAAVESAGGPRRIQRGREKK